MSPWLKRLTTLLGEKEKGHLLQRGRERDSDQKEVLLQNDRGTIYQKQKGETGAESPGEERHCSIEIQCCPRGGRAGVVICDLVEGGGNKSRIGVGKGKSAEFVRRMLLTIEIPSVFTDGERRKPLMRRCRETSSTFHVPGKREEKIVVRKVSQEKGVCAARDRKREGRRGQQKKKKKEKDARLDGRGGKELPILLARRR